MRLGFVNRKSVRLL